MNRKFSLATLLEMHLVPGEKKINLTPLLLHKVIVHIYISSLEIGKSREKDHATSIHIIHYGHQRFFATDKISSNRRI